ncbi:MAG: hypothetical protein ABH878_08455 [bacterium]
MMKRSLPPKSRIPDSENEDVREQNPKTFEKLPEFEDESSGEWDSYPRLRKVHFLDNEPQDWE